MDGAETVDQAGGHIFQLMLVTASEVGVKTCRADRAVAAVLQWAALVRH